MIQPRLSIIVAMTLNRVIGANNTMPWHLPADLAFFKATTLGHPVIMGRKTYESIGRPLPGRRNIVVTRDPTFRAPGCEVAHSVEESLFHGKEDPEIFVIGGAGLYCSVLPATQRIYLTEIQAEIHGDTYFPEIESSEWQEVSRMEKPRDPGNAYDLTFITLDRRPS
ncbi:MAG: type 3 dihydrofolate reductase [Betaproteobacteria bacterium]|nr:type 3 dihydrofolate reductase [Betaproteobacteria bacterium]